MLLRVRKIIYYILENLRELSLDWKQNTYEVSNIQFEKKISGRVFQSGAQVFQLIAPMVLTLIMWCNSNASFIPMDWAISCDVVCLARIVLITT